MILGVIMYPMRKLKINMIQRILLYFMLFVCLLTKDGISFAFDFLKERVEMTILNDITWEDSMEEEGEPEDWLDDASVVHVMPQIYFNKSTKTAFPERNEARLHVLLEQISPPPRMA